MSPLRVALIHTNYEMWEIGGEWHGAAFAFIDLMLKISNISFVYVRGEQFTNGSTNFWNDCIDLMKSNLIDVCPLMLSMTKERSDVADYITPYLWENHMNSYIFKAPNSGRKRDVVDFFKVLYVFDLWVWLGVVVCVVLLPLLSLAAVGVLSGWREARERGMKVGEDFYRLLVAQDVERKEGNESMTVRVLFGVWILACIVLNLSFRYVVDNALPSFIISIIPAAPSCPSHPSNTVSANLSTT